MLVGASPRRVAIVGGARIPFARGNGAYAQVGNQEMLVAALRGLVGQFGLQGQRIDDVAAGAVMKHSSQWNLTRESVFDSGLAAETPGLDLQRACGTSLEAAILLGNKIALGQIECGIAGGVDTVSDPPVVFPRSFQQLLLRSFRGNTALERMTPWLGLRPKSFRPVLPGIAEPRTGLSMGESTELMVKTWGISRTDQDQLALLSHQTAAAAYAQGFYKDLVHDYLGLSQDNNIRTDTTLEKLAKLKPAFDFSGAGTLTAGNSTPMTDGAAAVLLASPDYAKKHGLKPRARVVAMANVGDSPTLMLNAPVPAARKVLEKAGLTLDDIDLFEINEAFAVVAEKFIRDLKLDRDKVNVNGGAMALGHPIGATGSILIGTILDELERRDLKRGLVTMCAAGGMAPAIIIERMN